MTVSDTSYALDTTLDVKNKETVQHKPKGTRRPTLINYRGYLGDIEVPNALEVSH